MICQISGCLDPKHHTMVALSKHIAKDHLDKVPIPCPVLGKFLIYLAVNFYLQLKLQIALIPWLLLKVNILTSWQST